MRILLTNDDGIRAPGILALHEAITAGPDPDWPGIADEPIEVYTVAPLTVQSATSHGVTFSEPLMARPAKHLDGTSVDGRPADCVKLALSTLWPERFGAGTRPDLVISGMNAGANCGINVIYSGTVAAAIEAAFLGIPSIAVSLHLGPGRTMYDVGAQHAARAIRTVLASGPLAPHSCTNINVPRCETPIDNTAEGRERVRADHEAAGMPAGSDPQPAPAMPDTSDTPAFELGPDRDDKIDPHATMPIAVCPMNTHGLIDRFERRESPAGHPYYWSAAGGLDFHQTEPGTDVDLLFKRHITVTPLTFDLTDRQSLTHWRERLG
ncbi:MAG: 5'/3'-nucleotidase SurE [Planctomycetota bacterium]